MGDNEEEEIVVPDVEENIVMSPPKMAKQVTVVTEQKENGNVAVDNQENELDSAQDKAECNGGDKVETVVPVDDDNTDVIKPLALDLDMDEDEATDDEDEADVNMNVESQTILTNSQEY